VAVDTGFVTAVFSDWTSALTAGVAKGVASGVAMSLPGVGVTGGVAFFAAVVADWTLAA